MPKIPEALLQVQVIDDEWIEVRCKERRLRFNVNDPQNPFTAPEGGKNILHQLSRGVATRLIESSTWRDMARILLSMGPEPIRLTVHMKLKDGGITVLWNDAEIMPEHPRGEEETWYSFGRAPFVRPHASVQWKGTGVCADLHCVCGAHGHIDDGFMYFYRCTACNRIYMCCDTFRLLEVTQEQLKGWHINLESPIIKYDPDVHINDTPDDVVN